MLTVFFLGMLGGLIAGMPLGVILYVSITDWLNEKEN